MTHPHHDRGQAVRTDPPSDVLAELSSVTVTFPRRGRPPVTAVHDVSLTARSGRILCLSGRSGAGKSCTLSVLAGFLAPTAGDVLWQGRPVTDLASAATTRRRLDLLAVLDQDAEMLDELTLRHNVTLPLTADRTPMDEARRENLALLLDDLGITALADRRPHELSGGERQRAGIARAFVRDSPLVLLDEPTSQLDERATTRVLALLDARRTNGTSVVVSSHDPAVLDLADDILTMTGASTPEGSAADATTG